MKDCKCKADTLSHLKKGYKYLDILFPKKEKKDNKKPVVEKKIEDKNPPILVKEKEDE